MEILHALIKVMLRYLTYRRCSLDLEFLTVNGKRELLHLNHSSHIHVFCDPFSYLSLSLSEGSRKIHGAHDTFSAYISQKKKKKKRG
jgi:hypothetical protein